MSHENSPAGKDSLESTLTDKLLLKTIAASGPFKSLNPTNVQFSVKWKGSGKEKRQDSTDPTPIETTDSSSNVALLWRARDNRKNRGSIAVPVGPSDGSAQRALKYRRRRLATGSKQFIKNMIRMCTVFPYWDMAYLVAMAYTIGSVIWVINGFFAWLPIAYPQTEFENETTTGNGVTAFMGVIFFQIGAYLALLEAINDGCFHGSAMRRILEGRAVDEKQMVDAKVHEFFRHLAPTSSSSKGNKQAEKQANEVDPEAGWRTKSIADENPGAVYPPNKSAPTRRGAMDLGADEGESREYMTFKWWFSWQAFKSHHVHEVGFLACFIQFIGATIFLVTGTVALPPIITSLEQWQLNAAYWIPQMIASAFFITASMLFVLETQEKWYKPAPQVLGWWIGFGALVGSIGFEYVLHPSHIVVSILTEYQNVRVPRSSVWQYESCISDGSEQFMGLMVFPHKQRFTVV
jgi:hypothetical protein